MNDKGKETFNSLWDEEIIQKLQDENEKLKQKIDKLTKFVDHCAYQLDMQYAREVIEELDEN